MPVPENTEVIEFADGEKKVVELSDQTIIPKEANPDSGMFLSMQDYLEVKAPVPPVTPPTSESETLPSQNEPPVSEDEWYTEITETVSKLNEPTLVEKLNAGVTGLKTKIKDYETQVQTLNETLAKSKDGASPEAQAFFDMAKVDFSKAWEQYKDKFGLPDFEIIKNQVNTKGSVGARLEQYISTTIKPQVEKEFNIPAGEFKFDLNEAHEKPTSASARFLELKNTKEQELNTEKQKVLAEDAAVLSKIVEQQKADTKWYADTYLGGDMQRADAVFTEMQNVIKEISLGKASFDSHPFSLRNVLRGFKAEEIIETEVKKALENYTNKLTALGVQLPSSANDYSALDLRKAQSPPAVNPEKKLGIQRSEFSPMVNSMFDYI